MLAALALGESNATVGSRGRDPRHRGGVRPAAAADRGHPVLQAPQGPDEPRDDHAPRGEGPADTARAAGAPEAGTRGSAGRAGAGRPGDRPLRLLRGMGPGVVDRAHPGPDGGGAADRLEDRERLAPLMPGTAASDDAALIRAVQQGDDRAAFAELVRRHQSTVRTVLRRLARGDHGLADDLAQETF